VEPTLINPTIPGIFDSGYYLWNSQSAFKVV
jgi:hypothetical protein